MANLGLYSGLSYLYDENYVIYDSILLTDLHLRTFIFAVWLQHKLRYRYHNITRLTVRSPTVCHLTTDTKARLSMWITCLQAATCSYVFMPILGCNWCDVYSVVWLINRTILTKHSLTESYSGSIVNSAVTFSWKLVNIFAIF